MVMKDTVVEGSGNFNHLGFCNVHPNLSARTYSIFTFIENAAAAARIRSRNLRVRSRVPATRPPRWAALLSIQRLIGASSERSYGRGPKTVWVECRFVEYDAAQLSREKDCRLLDQAHLHVYCTDCNDLEAYRSRVRDEIIEWMSQLKEAGIYDWMLVAVEPTDARRANKAKLLSRATVYDRMRADFPSKTFDRCVQVSTDSSGSVGVAALLGRLRQLLLHATGRHLGRYEELIRMQRERRTASQWSFLHFFFLQEELAFVLEALGLYDEALVQYDELDALFTQVVINSASGEMPEWLCQLAQLGCEAWGGLRLGVDPAHSAERQLLLRSKGSLLQLRNYLFSRQCALLRLQNRTSEMASRTLSFLHNTVHELGILEECLGLFERLK
ncbi:hypothetical protein HPB51_013939 [Rhipicephalus microplus]|uniref:TRAPPC10/Trs130 N-terminal domain-containing protein n=1 Tax=Rhipicephalus microplus TaxID=6941 RepID=A0A9J6DH74_RHIMP|nr:hypothetical protein HPB51_013939 [Rhipicephalus microplus]